MSERIVEILKNGSDEERIDALIEILQERNFKKDILEEVFKLFSETQNEIVRERCEEILTEADCCELEEKLISLFSHPEPIVRNTAIQILQRKGEKVIEKLKEALNSDDKDIRKLVLDTASGIESPKVVEIIEKGLSDEDINVKISAVEYAGKLELKELSDKIFEIFISAKDPFLKITALETLSIIDEGKHKREIVKEIESSSELKDLLAFPYIKYLGENGSADELKELSEMFDSYGKTYLKELTNAVEHIVERENIEKLPDFVFEKLEELLFSEINPINKYGLITFFGNFESEKLCEILKKAILSDEKMLVLGALEVIAAKGIEGEFKEEILSIKDKFMEDEDLKNMLEDLVYLLEE